MARPTWTEHFRFFDTICGATQDRQDALEKLLREPMDLLLVIGGYNSSNTSHLAEMGEAKLPTYFIKNAAMMVSDKLIRHYSLHDQKEVETSDWLPAGKITVGITAGASCPEQFDRGRHPAAVRVARHFGAGIAGVTERRHALLPERSSSNGSGKRWPVTRNSAPNHADALYSEPPPFWRTEYQRDRDRVIHSRAFRRLEYKTQVFLNGTGDHLRTRLTHTIEVAAMSRSIARALRLNEDLAETIALAHDLGHSPFGHRGEAVLNRLMRGHGGFEHNRQSLRIVEELEEKYPGLPGVESDLGSAGRSAQTSDHL